MAACTHYPHVGSRKERKAVGGPFAGIPLGFYECQTEMAVEDKLGRCVGRYVIVEVQQKTRVIRKVVWDGEWRPTWKDRLARLPAAERYARLRGAVLHDPGRCTRL